MARKCAEKYKEYVQQLNDYTNIFVGGLFGRIPPATIYRFLRLCKTLKGAPK